MSKHVAVLMGGWSAEREVSLRSGKACADAAERAGYRVSRVDVGRDIAAVLKTLKPDAALNVLHGRPGEDGTLQGLLEIAGIPYSHSGVMASALAMQKDVAKVVMKAAGVPVPEGQVVSRRDAAKGHPMDRPYVIKPIAEGSSVGVFIVTEQHEHPPQELNREDWAFGEQLLVEKLHPRQGADLRRGRRQAHRRHRNRRGHSFLRLRGEICPGRFKASFARSHFTFCLPRGPKTSAQGALRPRLPRRDPR